MIMVAVCLTHFKVEEATRKGETQLRALKRGEGGLGNPLNAAAGGGAPDDTADDATDSGGAAAAATDNKSSGSRPSDKTEEGGVNANVSAEYERRLGAMQVELARVTGELEQARQGLVMAQAAAASSATASAAGVAGEGSSVTSSAPTKPFDASSNSGSNLDRDQQQQVHAAELELLRLQAAKDAEIKAKEERLRWQQQQHTLQQSFDEEKAVLLQRVRDEETRASQLAAEIARIQARADGQPQTPQMMQFNAMEQHLKLLEARTDRRERELVAAVEEVSDRVSE